MLVKLSPRPNTTFYKLSIGNFRYNIPGRKPYYELKNIFNLADNASRFKAILIGLPNGQYYDLKCFYQIRLCLLN